MCVLISCFYVVFLIRLCPCHSYYDGLQLRLPEDTMCVYVCSHQLFLRCVPNPFVSLPFVLRWIAAAPSRVRCRWHCASAGRGAPPTSGIFAKTAPRTSKFHLRSTTKIGASTALMKKPIRSSTRSWTCSLLNRARLRKAEMEGRCG